MNVDKPHSFLSLEAAKIVECGVAPAMYLHRRPGRGRVDSEHLIKYKVGGRAGLIGMVFFELVASSSFFSNVPAM